MYGKALEGLSAKQVALALSTENTLSPAQIEEIIRVNELIEKYGAEELIKVGLLSTNSALLASEKTLSAEKLVGAMVDAGANKERAEEFVKKHATTVVNGEETTSEVVLTRALLDEAVTNNILQKENAETILSKKGIIAEDLKELASKKALAKSLKMYSKTLVSTMLIIGSVIAIYKIYDEVVESAEEATNRLETSIEKATSKYNDITSSIDNINTQLEENKTRIKELNALESPTYVEQEELEKLKQVNSYLENNKKILEESQKASAQKSVTAIYEKFKTDFYTNDTKTIDDVASSKLEKFVAKLPIGKQVSEFLVTKTDEYDTEYEKLEKSIELLKQYKSLQDSLLSSGNDTVVGELVAGNPLTSVTYSYEDLNKEITQCTENINDYKSDLLVILDEISEFDSNYETQEAQEILHLLDVIEASVDIDSFGKRIAENVANSSDFSEISKSISETIKDGINLSYEDLLADGEYSKIINEIAKQMLVSSGQYESNSLVDAMLGDGYLLEQQIKNSGYAEKAASYLISLFNEEIEQEIENSSPLLSITDSIKQIADQLEPQFAKLGEAYRDIFTDDGFTLENIDNSMLEDLRSSFADIEEDLGVTFDTTQLDNFFDVLTNGSSTADDVQNAFNRLAGSYLNSTDVLESLNEETAESVIKQLEQMGVTNAEALVNDALTLKLKWVEKAKENNIETTNELLDATYEEISALKDEDGKLDETEQKLYNLWMQKNAVNNITIMTNGDVQNLVNLMETADAACENLKKLAKIKSTLATLDKMYTSGEISASAYQSAVETNTKLLNGEDIVDDFTGQTSNIKGILSEAQKEIDTYYTNFGVKVNYDGNTSSDADKDDSSSKDSDPKQFDWIERAISKMDKSLDELDSKVANTYSTWIDRNKDLSASISKTTEAIALQKNAANAYMNEASKIGLDSVYVGLIQNGALDISEISDEDLADKISEYQSLYDSAQNCLKTAQELENSLNELQYNEQWELFSTEIDADINEIEEYINTWQSKLDKAELQGRFANSSYYENMRALTENQLEDLTTKANKLQSILGNMTQGTEAYDTLFAEFLSIEGEIRDLENQIIEFNNNIRDLNWEIFEYLEDSISRITDETEYLNNLINESDLFDEGGNFTEYGDASLGLYAVAYDTYKQQAEDYYEEVQELQRQLVNGAGKDVLEQYYKMVDAHQDAILAAKDEKKAILDLVEEGYNAQLDALNKIIDKKKEAMSEISDLYNYQKSIEEKTSNIASLKKQEKAFLNDDSEYGMSQLQKIQLELSNAEKDLEQTEREQFLQDSQKMLDELYDNYEEFLNSRLDNEDALLQEIISNISGKGDEINATLNQVASDYGTFISDSITSIFDANSPFTSGLTNIATNVAGTTNAINTLISQVSGIAGALNVKTNAGTGSTGSTSSISSTSGSSSNNNSQANSTSSNATSTATANSNSNSYDGIFIYKKYYKQNLNTNTSVVDRLKSNDIDASWSARAQYWSKIFGGAYTGSESQNIKFLNWLKNNGYKSGTSSASKGLHLWDEEGLGSELILTKEGSLMQFNGGEHVFNKDMVDNLWNLAQLNPISSSVNMPDFSKLSNRPVSQDVNMNIGDVSVTLPNVTNYKEFRNELIKDSTFTNAMGTYVNNQIMNKNPLAHLQYSRR